MFEDQTFNTIINRMLDSIDKRFDKREGSIIYDALAPAAIELADLYISFDNLLNQAFPLTADREYLIQFAKTFSITPYEATKAIVKIEIKSRFNSTLPIGTRFNKEDLNYIITEIISPTEYYAECETGGNIGNLYIGTILPITTIAGLQRAEITEIVIPGEDEEDTEIFRQRFFDNFKNTAFGGNRADYIRFVNALQGVGGCKIVRCPEGPGSVYVYIIDSRYQIPTIETLEYVQNELQPEVDTYPELHTCGLGIAPIGHEVTVLGVQESPIDIEIGIVYENGYSWEIIQNSIEEKINTYFLSLREKWANSQNLVVQIIDVIEAVLEVQGVLDISLTKIKLNGNTENVILDSLSIPKLGNLTEFEGEEIPETPKHCCPDCQLNYDCSNCERVLNSQNG